MFVARKYDEQRVRQEIAYKMDGHERVGTLKRNTKMPAMMASQARVLSSAISTSLERKPSLNKPGSHLVDFNLDPLTQQ